MASFAPSLVHASTCRVHRPAASRGLAPVPRAPFTPYAPDPRGPRPLPRCPNPGPGGPLPSEGVSSNKRSTQHARRHEGPQRDASARACDPATRRLPALGGLASFPPVPTQPDPADPQQLNLDHASHRTGHNCGGAAGPPARPLLPVMPSTASLLDLRHPRRPRRHTPRQCSSESLFP